MFSHILYAKVSFEATILEEEYKVNAVKKNLFSIIILCIIILANQNITHAQNPIKNTFSKRYFMYHGTLSTQDQLDRLVEIMRHAKHLGYNGMFFASSGYSVSIFKSLIQKAKELDMVIIPRNFGPSDIIYEGADLNQMLEALPINDSIFYVQNGIAAIKNDENLILPNKDFEDWDQDKIDTQYWLKNWTILDNPGTVIRQDNTIAYNGNNSILFKDPSLSNSTYGYQRVMVSMNLKSYKAYEVSFWLKTSNFTVPSSIGIFIYGKNADNSGSVALLRRTCISAKNTQDWTKYSFTFTSLSKTKATLYFGLINKGCNYFGNFWLDGANIRELGLCNMVRRSCLPIVVKSYDEKIIYQENIDYIVENGYLVIPFGSSIIEEELLRVSWYLAGDIYGRYATSCHYEYYNIIEKTLQRLSSYFNNNPYGFLINIDEWAVANWDPCCSHITAGEYMAETFRKTEEILLAYNPNLEIFVWSDMFDPYHNAIKNYYAVNGSVEGSWEGLSSKTIIVNWDYPKIVESLKFFSEKEHRQILGINDDSDSSLSLTKKWLDGLDFLESQPNGISNIEGCLFFTLIKGSDGGYGEYKNLGPFASLMKERGRWVLTANDDNYNINEDSILEVSAPGILSNDIDLGDFIKAEIIDNPLHGILVLNSDGSFIYTPNTDYNGTDTFKYRTTDGKLTSNIAMVNIKIDPINDKPIVNDLAISPVSPSTKDNLTGSYTYNDADGDPEGASEIRWYKNGVLQAEYNNKLIVPSSVMSSGDTWYFTVRPFNGIEYGELGISASVTINSANNNLVISLISPLTENNKVMVNKGDEFDLQIRINTNNTEINGASIYITFDNTKLQPAIDQYPNLPNFQPFLQGGFIGAGDNNWITNKVNGGKLDYAEGRISGTVSGSGLIATVSFIAIDSVLSTPIIFDFDLGNVRNTEISIPDVPYTIVPDSYTNAKVTINSPPSVINLAITPDLPLTADDLIGMYTFTDTDGDPEIKREIKWYKNDILQPDFNDQLVIPDSVTNKGEKWHFTIRASDGKCLSALATSSLVTIGNTPPSAWELSINLNPSGASGNFIGSYTYIYPDEVMDSVEEIQLASTDDNLLGTYIYNDPDGDIERASQIRWYKNNDIQIEYSNQLTIPSSATSKGEAWYFTVLPNDGTENGVLQTSPSVVIVNLSPNASDLAISPATPSSADDLTGSYSYADADGDSEGTSEIKWYKTDVHQAEYDNKLMVPASATSKGETWHFTVKPYDGTSYGEIQASPKVTVINTPPSASNLAISPASPRTANDLTATYTYSDPEGDAETGTEIRWYKDNVLQPEYNDKMVVLSTSTKKNQIWYFTVKPYDGSDYGDIQTSSSVKILNSPPVAKTVEQYNGVIDNDTAFTSEGTIDPDGDTLTYRWDFDASNGTSDTDSTEPNPNYVYTQVGTYTVTLVVSDDEGNSDTVSSTADVKVDINGNAKLQGHGTNPASVNITIRPVGSKTVLKTFDVDITDGLFNILTDINPGTYDITAKAKHYLKAIARNVNISGSKEDVDFDPEITGIVPGELRGGDCNNDNAVSLADFSLLSKYFGKTDDSADINGDGLVNIIDFLIFSSNYGYMGVDGRSLAPSKPSDVGNNDSMKLIVYTDRDPKTISPGDEFEVYLRADSASKMKGYSTILQYDTEVFHLVDTPKEGAFLKSNREGRSTLFISKASTGEIGNLMLSSCIMNETQGVSGGGILASLRFRLSNASPGSLSIYQPSIIDSRERINNLADM